MNKQEYIKIHRDINLVLYTELNTTESTPEYITLERMVNLSFPIDYEMIDIIQQYIDSKYYSNISVPTWLYCCMISCCYTDKKLIVVLFNELMDSISTRKFNGKDIPLNYVIKPEDWLGCYPDKYPICIERSERKKYIKRYNKFLSDAKNYAK